MWKPISLAAFLLAVLLALVSSITWASRGVGEPAGFTGGKYPVDVNLFDDPCGHDPFIGMPDNLTLDVAIDGQIITISSQAGTDPGGIWVPVQGTVAGNEFFASGMGTVAGFPNTQVAIQGTIDPTMIQGQYAMGSDQPPGLGGLPPCDDDGDPNTPPRPHPAVYEIKPKPQTPTPTPPEKQFSITVLKLDKDTQQPLADFEFNLYAGPGCDGQPITSDTTDADGLLDFTGLPPGMYSIEEKPEPGWNVVGQDCQNVDTAAPLAAGVPACPVQPDAEFPQPGCDTFYSGGRVTFRLNSSEEEFSVTLNGPAQVARLNKPQKNADGLDQVDTELVFMELTGASPLGDLTVRESPTLASTGTIIEQENTGAGVLSFPADSEFDIYFEVDTPIGTLHNEAPLHLECKIEQIPPVMCFYQPPIPGPLVLYDAGGTKVAELLHAFHLPLPPNEVLVVFENEQKPTPTPTPTPAEKKYSITVLKVDDGTNAPLEGFEFNLYVGPDCAGDAIDSDVTDADGLLDFINLQPGIYSVEEKPEPGWNVVGEECQEKQVPGTAGSAGFVACPTQPDLPFPGAGCDSFQSGAQVNIHVNATDETYAVTLNGPTVIQRSAIMAGPPDTIDTEIIQLDLTGAAPVLGDVTVRQAAATASTGQIEEQVNTVPGTLEFPADSYFDVFFEVDALGITLHNQDPLHIECKIQEIPPIFCFYQPPIDDPVVLYNDAKVKIATIVHAMHIPLPPNEVLVVFRNVMKEGGSGDADKDGEVTSIDAALTLQDVAGIFPLVYPENADTDQDGDITSIDAALMLQFVADIIDGLPV